MDYNQILSFCNSYLDPLDRTVPFFSACGLILSDISALDWPCLEISRSLFNEKLALPCSFTWFINGAVQSNMSEVGIPNFLLIYDEKLQDFWEYKFWLVEKMYKCGSGYVWMYTCIPFLELYIFIYANLILSSSVFLFFLYALTANTRIYSHQFYFFGKCLTLVGHCFSCYNIIHVS